MVLRRGLGVEPLIADLHDGSIADSAAIIHANSIGATGWFRGPSGRPGRPGNGTSGLVADEPEVQGGILAATLGHNAQPVQSPAFHRPESQGGEAVDVRPQALNVVKVEDRVAIRINELQDREGLDTLSEDALEIPGGIERSSGRIRKPTDLIAVVPLDDR